MAVLIKSFFSFVWISVQYKDCLTVANTFWYTFFCFSLFLSVSQQFLTGVEIIINFRFEYLSRIMSIVILHYENTTKTV